MGWLLKLATGNPLTLLYLAGAIALASAVAGGTAAWKIQGVRLETSRAETAAVRLRFDNFKAEVTAQGKVAKEKADAQAAKDRANKEKADVESKRLVTALRADIARLRHDRDSSRGSIVPAAPATSSRPDLACFARAEFEPALRAVLDRIRDRTRGLVDEGSEATVNLDTAKAWGLRMSTSLMFHGEHSAVSL